MREVLISLILCCFVTNLNAQASYGSATWGTYNMEERRRMKGEGLLPNKLSSFNFHPSTFILQSPNCSMQAEWLRSSCPSYSFRVTTA